jgi:hypothetical protein
VALAYDETEGLMFLANIVLVREAFEDPGLAADSEHRQAVLGYLKADSISALPFRRLAEADTARASQLFQHLLKKPGFSRGAGKYRPMRAANGSAIPAPAVSLRSCARSRSSRRRGRGAACG